jgi:hypothetical protein
MYSISLFVGRELEELATQVANGTYTNVSSVILFHGI